MMFICKDFFECLEIVMSGYLLVVKRSFLGFWEKGKKN